MRRDSLFKHSSGATESTFMLKTGITSPITCLTMLPNKICIGSHDGIFFYDRSSGKETHVLRGIDIYRILKAHKRIVDWNKNVWIIQNQQKGEIRQVPFSPGSPTGISSWQIRDLWKTANGTSGLEHLTDYINIVRKQDSIPLSKSPNT